MKVTYLMIMLQQWQSNHCTFDFLHFLLSNEHEDIDLHSDLCCGTVLILGTLTECVCVVNGRLKELPWSIFDSFDKYRPI